MFCLFIILWCWLSLWCSLPFKDIFLLIEITVRQLKQIEKSGKSLERWRLNTRQYCAIPRLGNAAWSSSVATSGYIFLETSVAWSTYATMLLNQPTLWYKPDCRLCFLCSRDNFFNNNYSFSICITKMEDKKETPVIDSI